jgi:hypothetical protein
MQIELCLKKRASVPRLVGHSKNFEVVEISSQLEYYPAQPSMNEAKVAWEPLNVKKNGRYYV